MDASTAAGRVGTGIGVFLQVLVVVGAISGLVGRLLHVPQALDLVLAVACAAGLIWYFTRRNRAPTA